MLVTLVIRIGQAHFIGATLPTPALAVDASLRDQPDPGLIVSSNASNASEANGSAKHLARGRVQSQFWLLYSQSK